MNISNNTVLITGGTAGIGLALAKKFMTEGNRVIVTGRDEKKLLRVKLEHPNIRAFKADMSVLDDVKQLSHQFAEANIWINNAAVQYNYNFADGNVSPETIMEELQINLAGPLMLTKLILPSLMRKHDAAIVNVSSGLGIVPKQNAAVYCATKSGMRSFTKSLRWQLENTRVRVFEIIPPVVDTNMTHGRGRGKISPETLVEEFWKGFQNDKYEMAIGRTKLLVFAHRYLPKLADRIMRNGL